MSKQKRHIVRLVRTFFIAIALICTAEQASAQLGFIESLLGKKKTEGEAADSTEVKERKPLESYFFDDDSLRNRQLFSWRMRPGFNQVDSLPIDTLLYRFEIDYPFLKHDVGSVYLGNLGGASRRLNYFEQGGRRDFTFLNAYEDYMLTPENAPFFNVKRPFTNLTYFMSGQTRYLEQNLQVTHAQNVSPSTGFNVHYLNRGTRGKYASQWAKNKNLSLAFAHTGKRYSVHAGYTYNMGDVTENGGIVWDGDLGDSTIDLPENINVRLQNNTAVNTFKTNTFYINQAYGIPLQRVTDADLSIADKSSIFIGHAFEYTTAHRKYLDVRSAAEFDLGDPNREPLRDGAGQILQWPDDPLAQRKVNYYQHWYYNPEETLDTMREHRIDNKLFVQIQPWNRDGIVGTIDGGIGHTMHRYAMFTPQDYLLKQQKDKESDTYIYGAVHGKLRKYIDWGGHVEYHLTGMRSQDVKFGGQLSMSAYIRQRSITLTVAASVEDRSPGYWMQTYRSNHYIWDNNFSKENEMRLEAKLLIPSIDLEVGAWHSTTTDKLYYGYQQGEKRVVTIKDDPQGGKIKEVTREVVFDVAPLQKSGTFSVTGIYLMKNFRLGILRLNHRVLFQESSDAEVFDVPQISAQASYFLDFSLVRNVLHMQIGLSGFYNTKYYAPGYNPALMQFHSQNFAGAAYNAAATEPSQRVASVEEPKKIGEYPYLDFFIAAKWKRMRILAKFQHANQDMFGSSTYFSALHHPMNQRVFRVGVSWSFYD